MCCSALAVSPMPPPSIRVPTIAALRHSRRVGRRGASPAARARRHAIHAASSAPAARNRVPIWKKGGKLTRANRIAR